MIFSFSATRQMAMAGLVALTASSASWAQDDAGVSINPDVFNMYLESRIQKPASQATAQEAALVRGELTDIYLLSEDTRAKALKEDPQIKAQLELQSRAILAQAVATDFVANNAATEDEMQMLYAEQTAGAAPLEYKARHILVETQGEAIALISELEGGSDFAELAKAKSTGPSGPSGGDLGWFPREQMVSEFSEAVVALGDGQFTKIPVQTQFGWHVILREDSRESPPPPYESVKEVLKQQVEQQKLRDFIAGLRGSDSE